MLPAPHKFQKIAMGCMLVMVLISFAFTNMYALLWTSSEWLTSAVLPAVIVDATNDERQDRTLATLRRSDVLDAAAQLKAEHMAKNSYFAHFSPDGVSPWHWFQEADYKYVHAGENLAIHFTDAKEVVAAWMESPTHKANIVASKFTEIGVGTARGRYDGYTTTYVVQLFGTPQAKPERVYPARAAASSTESATAATAETEATTEETNVSNPTQVLAASADEATSSEPAATADYIATDTTTEPTSEPEPTTIEESVTTTPSSSNVSTTSPATTSTNIQLTETGPIIYTDLVSTSTSGTPAVVGYTHNADVPFWWYWLTQPNLLLQTTYIGVALLVSGILLRSLYRETKARHLVHIAYSMGLLLLMGGLWHAQNLLTSGVLVL